MGINASGLSLGLVFWLDSVNVTISHYGVSMILRLRSAISLLTCWCFVTTVSASSANIGLVIATGGVQVDGVSVPGNAAIFSGSRIASDGISNLRFSDGTSAVMRPRAEITVYREHSVLLQGVTMQRGADKHPVIADGLRISGATPNAAVVVEVKDESHFVVAAAGGELEVRTSTGDLVSHVVPGKDLSFTISQAPAGIPPNNVQICGRLGGNDKLIDEFTSVPEQLQGQGLERYRGKTVQVIGTVVNPSATSQVVDISTIRVVSSCGVAGSGAAPAATSIRSGKGLILVGAAMAGLGAAIYYSVNSGGGPSPVTPAVP
jgi:hypothetical protein